ncbi:unnamed protein product [Protopolystoma xenopodis]|uniref:Uncharacterized protein n=1 Tax=Protopolystoma xenopodis TaxID=117903 RepID=A0A3S5AK72_9PLAT|nr:unnamed protein product [Protopolystoma xenopodis]
MTPARSSTNDDAIQDENADESEDACKTALVTPEDSQSVSDGSGRALVKTKLFHLTTGLTIAPIYKLVCVRVWCIDYASVATGGLSTCRSAGLRVARRWGLWFWVRDGATVAHP